MLQRILILAGVFLTMGSQLHALNSIDTFITNHCGSDCNGDGPNCRTCYNEAVDLYDQSTPDSPEMNFDLDDNHGKLEWEF